MQIPVHIQQELEQLNLSFSDSAYPAPMQDLLDRTVLYGGKRLRPLLLFYIGDFLGLELKRLAPFAAAIEQIHAASLSHDDVVDNGTLRRGRPSINQVGGNKKAVLAGDYLLADVLSKIVDQDCPAIMKETARVIQALSRGEWLQLDLQEFSPEQLRTIAINKTGSVISWCFVVPAILAGFSGQEIAAMRQVGERLGLAFQMIDDVLDFERNSLKDIHQDFQNGQINFVLSDYMSSHPGAQIDSDFQIPSTCVERVKKMAMEELEIAKKEFSTLVKKSGPLLSLFDLLVIRNY